MIVNKLKVGLVDDHTLFREGLANLLREYSDIQIVFSVKSASQMMPEVVRQQDTDVVLMDINMPEVDGYECARWLKLNYPSVHILALSMYEDEKAILRMIRSGAGGYILKESNTEEVVKGIRAIAQTGYYINEQVSGRLIHSLRNNEESDSVRISEKERLFLSYCCTELTYKEIADQMNVSPRTVDNYREDLFEKLNLHSRTGLVIYAIKHHMVKLEGL